MQAPVSKIGRNSGQEHVKRIPNTKTCERELMDLKVLEICERVSDRMLHTLGF